MTERVARLVSGLVAADRRAIAETLNLVEDRRPAARAEAAELLAALPAARLLAAGQIVGITGPPGVGKSTLTAALISHWRREGRRVGVLAVDPTSPKSGGALLGDRLRMMALPSHEGVFIRSLAGRGDLGGLSLDVLPMAQVLLAAMDLVLIETIGVGQSEVDVADYSDTACLVIQPGSGDVIQFLKAGVTEIPDLVVVNKADLGRPARRTANDVRAAKGGDRDAVLLVSATEQAGIDALAAAIDAHRQTLDIVDADGAPRLTAKRRRASQRWVLKRLRAQYGAHGIAQLGGETTILSQWADGALFERVDALEAQLLATLKT